MQDVQNLSLCIRFTSHLRAAKGDVRHDQTPDDSPMAWVELRTVDGPVYEARADTSEVTHADGHRECHAALNIAACGPTCPSKYDGDRGEHTAGSDNSATVRNLCRGGTSHPRGIKR